MKGEEMYKSIRIFGLIFLSLLFKSVYGQQKTEESPFVDFIKPPENAQNVKVGKKLYKAKCIWCHGLNGDGDGPAAMALGTMGNPKPRDFTKGIYKIRSTPSGQLPTNEDLFMLLTRGMPGTSMLSWRGLSPAERWQLVYYIKSFAKQFSENSFKEKIEIGNPLPITYESIQKGKRLYVAAECWKCHGLGGKGDGPSAPTLKDEWEYPIEAADLTVGSMYKGGNSRRDIYRTLVTGLMGTPMPSYQYAFEDEELWNIVNYIFLLSQKSPMAFEPLPFLIEGNGEH